MKKMVFIGAGSYGTAVANHVAEKHKDSAHVLIYGRDKKTVDEINLNHRNTKYLSGHELSRHLKSTSDLDEAVTVADYIFMGIPAQHVRKMTSQIRNYVITDVEVINLAKGVEVDSLKRMSEVIGEELNGIKPSYNIMTLSGPSFAKDVVDPKKSVVLSLGGNRKRRLEKTREMLHTNSFRVFACKDIVGVEIGGALKNVYAIMAGIMKGAGEGDSYLGEYIPRALVEMDSIVRHFGARRDTTRGVSTLGDLIITCSESSRNFRFGEAFARTGSIEEAMGGKTIEGYHTLEAMHKFVESKNMFAPIIRELHEILYESSKDPKDAITSFRQADSLRTWENIRFFSKVLGKVLPKFWYRRHDFSFDGMKREFF